MREADLELVLTFTVLVVRTPILVYLLRRDERGMQPVQLARSWAPATRDLAAVLLGSPALLVQAVKTRRSWRGAAYGLACMAAVEVVGYCVLTVEQGLLEWAFSR